MSIIQISLANDEFKAAFMEGSLAIDCLEIKLTQKGGAEPRVFSSSGFILIGAENGAEARLVIRRDESGAPYDHFSNIKKMFDIKSGELFPDSHFYALEATDIAGNLWTNSAVMLKVDNQVNAEIVSFECDHLEVAYPVEGTTDFAHFVFTEDLKFPMNRTTSSKDLVRGKERLRIERSHSSGPVLGMQVYYYKSIDSKGEQPFELVANAPAEQAQPEGFDERLLEAIRFCTAMMVWPVMSEVSRAGKRVLRLSKARPVNNGLVSRPLSGERYPSDFYRLMGCYYDYACTNAKEGNGAPLSLKLGGLFTLKGVWVDTIALLLCVATESILDDPLFKSLGKPDTTKLDLIKKLCDLIKTASIDDNLQARALSAMGSMKSNRAVDKMYALAQVAGIDEEDIKSWRDLRNRVAHGSFEVEEDKMQELLDQIYRLVTLIYKLTFLKIGYSGAYSNYAQRGWDFGVYDSKKPLDSLKNGD